MPKVSTEARNVCSELIEAIKILDDLSYARRYSEVFEDLVNSIVWEHRFPPDDKNPLEKYTEKEQQSFKDILKIIQKEVEKRTSLHLKEEGRGEWYDPLGRLYECVTSRNKSSMMGQYFTPKNVVDLMVEIQVKRGNEKGAFKSVLDPACGSGRMGLSAGAKLMANGNPCWVTMNDVDPICTKMTAANMCLNGIVGEALCSDGLDITGKSYRFGYRIEPMIAQVPEQMQGLYRMAMLAQTGQDINKLYVSKPVQYEQTYLKQVNERLLSTYKEAQNISEEEEKDKAIKAVKDTIQERMKGTLFEQDTTQIDNVENLKTEKQPKTRRRFSDRLKTEKDKKPPQGQQGKLF